MDGAPPMLINIDNGGTLTDFCVSQGAQNWRTKSLTTPHDLSQCLMDGLRKASVVVFGEDDVERLLLGVAHIRYSTTQGTNALVQRKGPKLGLVHNGDLSVSELRYAHADLFAALVGDRSAELPVDGPDGRYDAVRAVSDLAARGASRIVVLFSGAQREVAERTLKAALLRAFPPHLLGALPILYSHEVTGDDDDARRGWTSLFNAFLHPAMEKFLYSAEQRLRESRAQKPLLIFRNDGQSARVAKTTAVKTYSSGPRGGADGAVALARHYGIDHLISLDVGGTTTDVSAVSGGAASIDRNGRIEGVAVSLPLAAVTSFGVGGSSIIRVVDRKISVGPESVGSAPGPACFALGGTNATITDALFAAGVLDPGTYFGGGMRIDVERARAAVMNAVGEPLKRDEDSAIAAIIDAWVTAVTDAVRAAGAVKPGSVLAAFGGAGPLLVCRIADALGIDTVLIPKLAAVFSAFGIGFSDIGHSYEAKLETVADIDATLDDLRVRAGRGMAAEGIDPAECVEQAAIISVVDGVERRFAVGAADLPADGALSLSLEMSHALPHPVLSGEFAPVAKIAAQPSATRNVLADDTQQAVPLFDAASLGANSGAAGPAVLEEEYYTCLVDPGWRFVANAAGDIFLVRSGT